MSVKMAGSLTSGSSYYDCQHQLTGSLFLLTENPSCFRTLTLRAVCPSVQPVRLRQKWMAPHFIQCGFYMVVASSTGRADYQEWIVPRSSARFGLDARSTSHQYPVCKPVLMARSLPLARCQVPAPFLGTTRSEARDASITPLPCYLLHVT